LTRDLNILLKIATDIGGIRDEEGLQWQLLSMIFDVVPAERAAILLFGNAGELSRSAGWDRVRRLGAPVRVSRTVLHRVVQERAGLLVNDISKQLPQSRESLNESGLKSVLCVPVLVSGT
jgi:GAF domain-containing protein